MKLALAVLTVLITNSFYFTTLPYSHLPLPATLRTSTESEKEAARLSAKTSGLKAYAAQKNYSTQISFLIDMQLSSGRKRFFIYDLSGDSVLHAGLVTHYGFSNGQLFPKQRVGAEMPNSFEASVGLRHLYFDEGSKVTVDTGSIGNYWLSLRPNITPDSGSTSVSASLTARKYFAKAGRFLSLRIGAGFSPELQNFQSASGTVSKGFYSFKSQSLGLSY